MFVKLTEKQIKYLKDLCSEKFDFLSYKELDEHIQWLKENNHYGWDDYIGYEPS